MLLIIKDKEVILRSLLTKNSIVIQLASIKLSITRMDVFMSDRQKSRSNGDFYFITGNFEMGYMIIRICKMIGMRLENPILCLRYLKNALAIS